MKTLNLIALTNDRDEIKSFAIGMRSAMTNARRMLRSYENIFEIAIVDDKSKKIIRTVRRSEQNDR